MIDEEQITETLKAIQDISKCLTLSRSIVTEHHIYGILGIVLTNQCSIMESLNKIETTQNERI